MKKPSGFTLFELLIVMSVLSLLMLISIPALGLMRTVSLSNEVEWVAGDLKMARQRAISENRSLEIRFYSYEGELPDQSKVIRAIQTWIQTEEGTFTALSPIRQMEAPVIISEDSTLTRIGPSLTPSSGEEEDFPDGATYRAFRFRPAGTTNLDLSEEWFFTMHLEEDEGTPPDNFATIQIEPLTGAVRVFRP